MIYASAPGMGVGLGGGGLDEQGGTFLIEAAQQQVEQPLAEPLAAICLGHGQVDERERPALVLGYQLGR